MCSFVQALNEEEGSASLDVRTQKRFQIFFFDFSSIILIFSHFTDLLRRANGIESEIYQNWIW